MNRDISRREVLRIGGLASVFAASGCLRQATNQPSNEPGTNDQNTAATATSSTDPGANNPGQPSDHLNEAWQVDVSGGAVVATDDTFFLSPQDPTQLMAIDSAGNERWRNEAAPATAHHGLAYSENALAVCGQSGDLTVVDRESGDTQWTFTESAYESWTDTPRVSQSYVAAVNQDDSTNDSQRVYVFDVESGDVLFTKDYETASSVAIFGDRAFVVTINYLDVYDIPTATRTERISQFIGGRTATAGDRLYVGRDQFVSAYNTSGEETTRPWSSDIRGEPTAIQATQDGIYVGGKGGVYVFDPDGDRRWWGQTETTTGRPAVGQHTVFATTDNRRLYAFNKDSGDRITAIDLDAESSPQSRVAATGNTAVVMGETARAFTRPSGN